MKRIKRMVFVALLAVFPVCVNAAGSASISASDTVVNGNKVKATVTLRNIAAWDLKASGSGSTNGCSIHEVGDSGNGQNTTKYFSLECKATSLGNITFSYSGDVTSSDGKNTKISGSKKVTVVKPREKSTNNNLKGLGIEGYSITPEFNKDTLEYSSEIPLSVEKINIQADKEDGYASVVGSGEQEVKEGLNKFEIKVTSETGKEKVYVLNVNLVDNNPIEKSVDGKKYTVVKRASSLTLPEGVDKEAFTISTIKLNDLDIPVYTNESLKLTLIGLKDEKGNIYLYKYENENITDRYETLTSKVLSILIENPKEELEGYTKTTVTINNKEYIAYQNEYKDYALIYGTNLETKESNWYLYNIKENTMQTYMKDMIDSMNKTFKSELDQYKLVIMCLGGLSLFLLLIIVIQSSKKKKKKIVKNNLEKNLKEKIEDTKEIDTTEIIINKVENEELPQIESKKEKKKDKKHNKKESEFLNEDDMKEILDNKKDSDMDMEFFDDYKHKKKKKK